MAIDQYGRPIPRRSSDKLNNPSGAFDPRGPKQEIVVVQDNTKAPAGANKIRRKGENAVAVTEDGKEYKTVVAPLPFYLTGVSVFIAAIGLGTFTFGKYLLLAAVGAAVYFISSKACKPQKYEVQKNHQLTLTGFAETDEILRKADNELRSIKKSAQHIVKKDPEFAGNLTELVDDAYKLVDFTSDNADQVTLLRRFYNYYLPTLEKLARTYVKLEKSGSDVKDVVQTKEEIISAADAMKTLFKKQFDKMYSNTALDISTDVDVLEAMLESDGIRHIQEESKE